MEINFALQSSLGVGKLSTVNRTEEGKTKEFFENKDYGPDVSVIYIGWICVASEFEEFFKPAKPRYYVNEKISVERRSITLTNAFECEIKLPFEEIKKSDENLIKQIMRTEMSNLLPVQIRSIKKIKNFDVDRFSADLHAFLLSL